MSDIKTDVCTSDTYLTELFWERSDNAIRTADEKYHNIIFSVIFTILGNREDSEECVNDVYLKLWNSIPPNKPSSFRAYAIKIARNSALGRLKALSAQKRNFGARTCSLEMLEGSTVSELDEYDERSRQIGLIIENYLALADDKTMYIFMKRYYFGASISDIARAMKCSRSSVNQYIKKIKTELKQKLEEGGIYV